MAGSWIKTLVSLIGLFFAHEGAAAMDTHTLLKMADESRGNLKGISWEVVVESVENQKTTDSMTYAIKARGFDISGTNLAPPKSKGNKLLMSNNNMWFYKQGLSKPIPIAQRQKLTGNAAYGDIAATNYADDYEAISLPDESVDEEECYVFDLKSKSNETTYDGIKYWISKKRLVGVKAEFLTVSGKKFKMAMMEYGNKVVINGKERPFISKITIYDELMSGDVTYLNLANPRFEAIPDYVFNLNLLMK